MNRRLLATVAAIAAALFASGLLGLDRPLAEWVRASGIDNAALFARGLAALDALSGMHVWFWLAGCIALGTGLAGCVAWRRRRWPRVLIASALVQFATIETMSVGKDYFGRLRPHQLLDGGDWNHVWFAGGVSFPSGHSAFYFGLLLPLAAACPVRWLRVLLLAVPSFVALARIDLAKHFLSDVSASALIAALYALLFASILRGWLAPTPPHKAAPATAAGSGAALS